MKLWQRSVAIGGAIAAVLGVLDVWGVGLPLLTASLAAYAVIALTTPWIGVRLLDALILRLRGWFWAADQGRFHAFAGNALRVEDDGRQVWIPAADLQRILGRVEPEAVTAARHAGRWRRDEEGTLMLRVDAVVENLNLMRGRDDPRVLRLRRYLERELLYPAARRRERAR
ncbi:MAG: hypothetical protein KGL18_00680 [Burkholderiales bacterium]|nr:hypothetical protein [Burkholderiales bacterium]MDE1926308.1 hypothetical protein [Burkholderiales bacterium]MDE2160065.1 hypothetical protein [Burkholderiales bacterium]MDE2501476.1 hypothetical protein [Burkholderiales bacterium]